MFGSGDTETATLLPAPQKDKWGDPIPGTDTPVDIPGCLFAPGPSAEFLQGANQTEADGTLYMPMGSPAITAADRMRVRGDIYEVHGKPRVWGTDGIEVVLKLTTG